MSFRPTTLSRSGAACAVVISVVALLIGGCAAEEESTSRYSLGTPTARCGNGRAEGTETCDGADVGDATCISLGLADGSLACDAGCAAFNTNGCGSTCTPSCQGRQCGADPSCGQSCGSCLTGACDALGQCIVADPDAPSVLSFNTNVNTVGSGESVTFTVVVTDPDGIDDVIGGTLIDPVTTNSYGAFVTAASEGSYSMTVSWYEINQVRAIDFSSSDARAFVAQFHDQAGHMTSVQRTVTLSCSGEPACDGTCSLSRCGSGCVDLRQDEDYCGSCTNSCMAGGVCANGGCECSGWSEVDCPGVGCADLWQDGSNCGSCGKSCPSAYCDDGRCSCGGETGCPGSEICSEYQQGNTIYRSCFGVGDGYLSGSRTSTGGEVQLQIDGTRYAVCEWFTPRNVPEVICRELHGPNATVVSVDSEWQITTDLGVYPVCTGTEMRLADCELSFESNCPFDRGYFVECSGGGTCTPDCTDRFCGDDGCGGSCGSCSGDDLCGSDGVCAAPNVPPTWDCALEYYAAADGCDCECGAYDPDCDLPNQQLYGCSTGATGCSTDGHCL